jgi:UDP-GlcNAc:undecaprenyl-phosphate/decaprenyl-phosphate GlcNAc-1-phosphate transferase
MFALIPVVLSSLAVCFVLTPFLRDFFGFLGVVDRPDSFRKAHIRPVPRVGGMALVAGYFVAFIALAVGWRMGFFDTRDPSLQLLMKLSPAVVLIFLVGLYDDLKGLSPWSKLAGQACAAAYACWVGVRLAPPPGYTGPVIVIQLIGICWLVLCANAFNLIDGLDGLAAGVALIGAASILMAALIHHNPGLAAAITPLVGALVGFLFYNFNPASIFLGDCGSLLIGFLLGSYGLMWEQHAKTGFSMAAPFVAMALPVFEVGLSILRRFLRKSPIFGSDRNHIHHRILSLGLSHRDAALVLYGVAAVMAVLAVLQTILRPQFATVLILLFLVGAFVGCRRLGYLEFNLLGEFLFYGGFRRTLRNSIQLREYEVNMAAARTLEECWLALRNACREAEFDYVCMRVNGRHFEDDLRPPIKGGSRMNIRLSRSDEAIFGHNPGSAAQVMLIAPLAERLQEKLGVFAAELAQPAAASQSTLTGAPRYQVQRT